MKMKWIVLLFADITLSCITVCSILSAQTDSQTITFIPGSSKDDIRQNSNVLPKKVFQQFKKFFVSREFFGLSTLLVILKYIIDTKAAQKDLDSTNRKLDEVERHGFDNKKSLDSILQTQTHLSTLLTSMQEKIDFIDNHAKELKVNFSELQKTAKGTKKNTKLLEEKSNAMQQLIKAISEQVDTIQTDLSTARTNVTESLLEIQALKALDEEQKALLTSLHEIIKHNAVEVNTLQMNITDLRTQHKQTENSFSIMEDNLQKTHKKLEDTVLHNEVIKTKLSEQYQTVQTENQKLFTQLQEVKTGVQYIYQVVKGNSTGNE